VAWKRDDIGNRKGEMSVTERRIVSVTERRIVSVTERRIVPVT